ncbi:MAG: hypothetical protein ACNA7W_06970 [Pseudomonadales bacterium]
MLQGYRLHESGQIYRRLKVGEIVTTGLRAVLLVQRTILRCRRQHQSWPWSDYAACEQTPLGQLRQQFGILVADPGPTGTSAAPPSS